MSNKRERCAERPKKSSPACIQGRAESQGENRSSDNELSTHEQDDEFYKSVTSIILQYFDSSGLDESYTTFYDECQTFDYLLPENWGAEPSGSSAVDQEDIDKLLKFFDEENEEGLLEVWNLVMSALHDRNKGEAEAFQLSIYIRIYIALIPFRRNLSGEERRAAMQNLRNYFESQTDECTKDEEILMYFALPFVQDPQNHPVFSKLLTTSWVAEIRSRILSLAMALKPQTRSINPEDSDLAQLFQSWLESVQHTIELDNGLSWTLQTTPHPVTLTSSASFNVKLLKDDNPLRQFFQNIDELTEENKQLKIKEIDAEKKYSQLLNCSAILVGYLMEACQGKNPNMFDLKNTICKIFPQMSDCQELRTNRRMLESGRLRNASHECPDNGVEHFKTHNSVKPRNRPSQNQNVYNTQNSGVCRTDPAEHNHETQPHSSQKAFVKELSSSEMNQLKAILASRSGDRNPYNTDATGEHTSRNDKMNDQLEKAADYDNVSPRLSSRSRTHRQITQQSKSARQCTSSDQYIDNNSKSSLRTSEKELQEYDDKSSRPRTYDLESSGLGPIFNLPEIDDCQKFYDTSDTKIIQLPCSNNIYSSPGRRTYRVRMVEGGLTPPLSSNRKYSSRKNPEPLLQTSLSINKSSRGDRDVGIDPRSDRGNHDRLEIEATKQYSSRLTYKMPSPRGPVRHTPRRPAIVYNPPTDKNTVTSNSNASWQKVSHVADNIAINSQAATENNELKNQKYDSQPKSQRRTVSK